MWFVWMDRRKRKKSDQIRLVTAYTRAKHRKFLWNIIRGWRHQAVYGRIAGLYSRNDLMKSLTEQKQQCKLMEQEMALYVRNVNEMNKLLEENASKVKEMEKVVAKKENKAREYRMAMHHCEQEMVKMQSLVECVHQVHPAVSKHIEELQQEGFDFEFRGLKALVELRRSEEEQTGKETELDLNQMLDEDKDAEGLLFSEEPDNSELGLVGDGLHDSVLFDAEAKGQEPDAGGAEVPAPLANATAPSLEETLLKRHVDFVLSRGDYRGILKLAGGSEVIEGHNDTEQLTGEGTNQVQEEATTAAINEDTETEETGDLLSDLTEEDNEVIKSHILADELVRMYGLVEFLRDGNVGSLHAKDSGAWKELEAKIGHETTMTVSAGGDKEGGKPGTPLTSPAPQHPESTSNAETSQPPAVLRDKDRKWKRLTNPATVTGDPYQWKDFLLAINRRLPKNRKTGSVQEKVMNRISIGKERSEGMIIASTTRGGRMLGHGDDDENGNADKNLYTGKDFKDSFKPKTPRGFNT